MTKPAKKLPTEKFPTKAAGKRNEVLRNTQIEGDADRAEGRKTRVMQPRGRLRS